MHQAVQRPAQASDVARQQGLAQAVDVVAGDVEHRLANLRQRKRTGGVEQAELLDFLVRREQVAFDTLGDEFQAFEIGALLLAAQAAGDPARQFGQRRRVQLDGDAGIDQRREPDGLFLAPVEFRQGDQQQGADLDSLKFIAERVEGNLLAAHQEIQKLGLLYPAGALSLAQIREAVLNVARYDIDGLREALLAGDIARLSRTLDGLMHEGEAPPLVLWAMSEEIRALAILRSGLDRGRPLEQLLKEAKVWGPRQNPVKKALQRLSTTTLEAALQHAGKIDRLAKGVGQGNIWEEFLRLGLSLSTQK